MYSQKIATGYLELFKECGVTLSSSNLQFEKSKSFHLCFSSTCFPVVSWHGTSSAVAFCENSFLWQFACIHFQLVIYLPSQEMSHVRNDNLPQPPLGNFVFLIDLCCVQKTTPQIIALMSKLHEHHNAWNTHKEFVEDDAWCGRKKKHLAMERR